jgi:hypothetical protein
MDWWREYWFTLGFLSAMVAALLTILGVLVLVRFAYCLCGRWFYFSHRKGERARLYLTVKYAWDDVWP